MDWEYPWSDAVSKRLADAIKKAGNVILSFKLLPAADKKSFTATGYPIRVLRDTAWATGFITIPKEGETVYRLLLAAQDKNKQLHYSFPLLVLAKYKDIKKEDIEVGDVKKIKIGDLHIPVERENLLWINYHSMFREIDEEKSEYVITLDEALNTESDKFHDKIILIGKTRFKEKGRIESEAEDILPTPVGKMSGILIYANSISSILQRRFITLMSPSAQYLLLLLLILFISFSTIALKPDKSLILFSSTIVILCSFFF
jgi:CHASE2 domain-containing sensor protein